MGKEETVTGTHSAPNVKDCPWEGQLGKLLLCISTWVYDLSSPSAFK